MQDTSLLPAYIATSLSIDTGSSTVDEVWEIDLNDAVTGDVANNALQMDCSLVTWPQATYSGVTELSQTFNINVHELQLSVPDQHTIINTQ